MSIQQICAMEYADALFATVVVFLFACFYMSNPKRRPPGPFGMPILGYLPFIGNHPAKKYFELSKKYGPVISLKLGPETFTVLNDYESIQEAFVRNGNVFSGRPQNAFVEAYSRGYGIVFRDYDYGLKAHRKFFLRTLKGFGVDKKGMESKVMEELEFLLAEIASTGEKPTSCRTVLARAVSNVISNVILGSRYSYEDERFQEAVKIVNQDITSDQLTAFCVNLMMVAPALRLIPPFSNVLTTFTSGKARIREMLEISVHEHREKLDKNHPRDFLDEYLLKMEEEEEGENRTFCEEQLYEAITDLFMAGTETTSSTISWALLLFAHRPEFQEKLHKEIVKVIGDGMPTMKHKIDMPYMNAFILELMRHRTLAPVALPHSTSENICFQGYNIPKGATVLPNIWAVLHDPKYFKNPDEFNPDRFIDESGNFINDPRVIPFSLGARYCLGEQLAKMEIFLFLSSIVQRFEIQGDRTSLPPFEEGVVGTVYIPKHFKVAFTPR